MNVNAIVGGKLSKLKLSPGLVAAWKQNKRRHMSETEAVRFVETKRREHALRQASPFLATRAVVVRSKPAPAQAQLERTCKRANQGFAKIEKAGTGPLRC